VKISIITPSFNQVQYLERTLESVHAQTGDFELEHIVVDGGSTDGSVALLERWKDKLWYVSERDRGQSHALNKGMARATGHLATWINSDDMLLPGALHTVARFFAERPTVQWAYGRSLIVDEQDREIRKWIRRYKDLMGRRYSYERLLLENYISQPSTFFRRALYDQVGGVDEALTYDMDYDLWLRFGRVADAAFIDATLASFRFHNASKTGGQVEQSLRAANQTARRHARDLGKPWLGELNYWLYYKRTALIYKVMDWTASKKR
jgi:glycosyltransferase involved in cell wall biosynthesis